MNERSINLRLLVNVWPLKENSCERMVSSTRRAKVNRSLTMAKHLAFDAIIVRRRVTQERCALNAEKIMEVRIMAMQPLFKMILNHLIFLWFQAVTREESGLWIQVALDT